LQAAVGLAQLEQLGGFVAKRAQIARWYRGCLRNLDGWAEPSPIAGTTPVNWLFTLRVRDLSRRGRDRVLETLREQSIDARPAFVPMSQLPPHRGAKLACAAAISGSALSLPTYVSMQKSDVETIAGALRRALIDTRRA
jgi:perosamine synthetase